MEQSTKAVELDGAEAIVLGCTGMLEVTQGLRDRLSAADVPAPVVDPTTAAVGMLQALIRNGLSQSRLTYYVPEDKVAAAGDGDAGGS